MLYMRQHQQYKIEKNVDFKFSRKMLKKKKWVMSRFVILETQKKILDCENMSDGYLYESEVLFYVGVSFEHNASHSNY